MPVGVTEYQDENGNWYEITLYEPGTFDFEPIEIQLGDGSWGVPFLQDADGADTPFEVQDSSGNWWGINEVGYVVIDDFEYPSNQFFDKYITPSTDNHGTTSYANAVDGSRVFWSSAPSYSWSVPQQETLNVYPEAGSRFVYHVRWETMNDQQTWLGFGGQDGTIYGETPRNLYEVRMNTNDGAMFLVYHPEDTGWIKIADTLEDGSGTVNFQTDTWYAVMVDWYSQSHDGRTGAKVSLYNTTMPDPSSDNPITSFDTANYSGSDYSDTVPQEEGSVGYRCGSHDVRVDRVIKYPPR